MPFFFAYFVYKTINCPLSSFKTREIDHLRHNFLMKTLECRSWDFQENDRKLLTLADPQPHMSKLLKNFPVTKLKLYVKRRMLFA